MHMDVKIKQDMDRQMALRENELYWRIYLLLNEGVPVVSKLVISRELGRHGSDLDFLLLQSKDQLKKTHRLNESEIEVLYPADGNTNIDKWNSNMFTSVILTIFRTSLLQNERKQIRDIHNILKELCINPDEYALDDETFDDHKTTLKDALSSLAFDKKVKSEIDDLINIYTNQPLNAADLLRHIEDINLSEETRQQLEIFLHSPPAIMGDSGDNTSDDVYEEESIGNVTSTNILDKGTQETPENIHSNDYDGDRQLSDAIDRENEVHADDDRYTVDTIYSRDTSEFHEEGKSVFLFDTSIYMKQEISFYRLVKH
ncbi:uncharacterized protein LOC123531650 [Mercenaria mercenaria]|uniref:uncharacterized protein LOC123531650 n=1 Tax=Mercenaria mercenaria TaxID=6596 RepID=UPI00234E4635|nr:uncharacterized protein LOC123531650 [Mercenaria mercenaria]XP_053373591.1 uncharacterized protein LOC123531650 [Mercenaria mercenaria]XP_053373592.1 uncharacterized protein LOC123531650 [Mercenaria mercenaria]XP_053373593.1 uncharacterized protein LOC123531650 [Mercenaria mercenaria]XP_053373594.1 uncharacterized protein LOC123531650 [Mercenaria mercenaria]XP_053373595.1 uncharacterized protein LOC123531650 [Mercenaria mercenaria]